MNSAADLRIAAAAVSLRRFAPRDVARLSCEDVRRVRRWMRSVPRGWLEPCEVPRLSGGKPSSRILLTDAGRDAIRATMAAMNPRELSIALDPDRSEITSCEALDRAELHLGILDRCGPGDAAAVMTWLDLWIRSAERHLREWERTGRPIAPELSRRLAHVRESASGRPEARGVDGAADVR